ncbi:MAG: hypothetical protein LBJ81_02370, partial [Puniceicoccales bacterium]|nr:hypothetical protein [Puniceicoccales bacterium]
LNNAVVNILLQSIIPPIGQNCSALKKGSNVGLFFLPNPKGTNAKENFFYCIVFQEEGNAFEEYLKKKQIFFQKEGGAIRLPEPGKTLESFEKDFSKKLVALAEQPSQSGVIEVNAKWWNVAQAMGWRNPGGDFTNCVKDVKCGVEFLEDASKVEFNLACALDPAHLDLKAEQCKKLVIGEDIDQRNAAAVILAQNIPAGVDIVKLLTNNIVKSFEKKVNPIYLKVVTLLVELLGKALALKIIPEIGSVSDVLWQGKVVGFNISKVAHATPEEHLDAWKSFFASGNDEFQKFLKEVKGETVAGADSGDSAGASEKFIVWEHKFLDDYKGFRIFTYTMDLGDSNFDVLALDSAKQDTSAQAAPPIKQDTSAKSNGTVTLSKIDGMVAKELLSAATKSGVSDSSAAGSVDGRRDGEAAPPIKQDTSSTEPNVAAIASKDEHREKEILYGTFYKGEALESDSLPYLKSVIDGIVARESLAAATKSGVSDPSAAKEPPVVALESHIGGFTAETIVKFLLDLGKYLPCLPQQFSKWLQELKKGDQKALEESGLFEKFELWIAIWSKFLSKENVRAQGIISGEVSVKEGNQLNLNFSVDYATIFTLMALRSVIFEMMSAKSDATKESKSQADGAPKEAASEKPAKAKETSTPPAALKTAFDFRLGDVIFWDKQILIPVKILTGYKAMG